MFNEKNIIIYGLISGYEDGSFRGQNSITRAETAAMIHKAYAYKNAK